MIVMGHTCLSHSHISFSQLPSIKSNRKHLTKTSNQNPTKGDHKSVFQTRTSSPFLPGKNKKPSNTSIILHLPLCIKSKPGHKMNCSESEEERNDKAHDS